MVDEEEGWTPRTVQRAVLAAHEAESIELENATTRASQSNIELQHHTTNNNTQTTHETPQARIAVEQLEDEVRRFALSGHNRGF